MLSTSRDARKAQHSKPLSTPAPALPATTHDIAFEVLLVTVSIVSTLFVVSIVVLVLVFRLLRRVAAAHQESQRPLTSASDAAGPSGALVVAHDGARGAPLFEGQEGEQQPLLQQHQGHADGVGRGARQPASATGRRGVVQQVRRSASPPGVFESLRIVMTMSVLGGRREGDAASAPSNAVLAQLQYQDRQSYGDAGVRPAVDNPAQSLRQLSGAHAHPRGHRSPPPTLEAAQGHNAAHDAALQRSSRAAFTAHSQSAAAPHPQDVAAEATRRQPAASPNFATDGEAATPFYATTQKDRVVFNTTHDSRYRLLQRIGTGAFSSVYLVQHKVTGSKYALKYILCKDDRERLTALRECEVIHCLQGHPQVVRIVDMFMNYQFQTGGGSTQGGAAAAKTATLAVASPSHRSAGAVVASSLPRQQQQPGLSASLPQPVRQSTPWQVTSTVNTQQHSYQRTLVASPLAARSLAQSPATAARHSLLSASQQQLVSPQPQQQQQQQQPWVSASAQHSNANPGGAAFVASPTTSARRDLSHAHRSPASPGSPVSGVAGSLQAWQPPAATTTWVGVQLQGLEDDVMKKVANATQLDDDEVVAALQARVRRASAGGTAVQGGSGDGQHGGAATAVAAGGGLLINSNGRELRPGYAAARSGGTDHYDYHNASAGEGEDDDVDLDSTSGNSDSASEPAPLILSAVDTERLLMDARLLQQRRHLQRAHNRRQRQQRKRAAEKSGDGSTAAGAMPTQRSNSFSRGLGDGRHGSLSSLHQHQEQQQRSFPQYPPSTSAHHASRSSSSTSRLQEAQECLTNANSLFGVLANGAVSPTHTSASSATRGSVASAPLLHTHAQHRSHQQRQHRLSAEATSSRSASAAATGNSGGVSYGRNFPLRPHDGTTATGESPKYGRWSPATPTAAGGAQRSASARSNPAPHGGRAYSPAHYSSRTGNSIPLHRYVGASGGEVDEAGVEGNTSQASREFASHTAGEVHSDRMARLSSQNDDSSSGSSSSGSADEPIQPIRRVLVPPPSYMHPPPGCESLAAPQSSNAAATPSVESTARPEAVAGGVEGNEQPDGSQRADDPFNEWLRQPSSPPPYVATNRYANFALSGPQGVSDAVRPETGVALEAEAKASKTAAAAAPPLLNENSMVHAAVAADVDAPSPAAAAAAAAAVAATARVSYAPRKQQQQQQPASSPSSSMKAAVQRTPVLSYAPKRAVAAAESSATSLSELMKADAPERAVSATLLEMELPDSPLSPDAGVRRPPGERALIQEDQRRSSLTGGSLDKEKSDDASNDSSAKAVNSDTTGSANQTIEPHGELVAAVSPARPVNAAGSGAATGTYAPGRPSSYVNPYLQQARGGEGLHPPPRTSYAPGGGVRYSDAAAATVASPGTTAIGSSVPPGQSPQTSGGQGESVVRQRGPPVRAWVDHSPVSQPQSESPAGAATSTAAPSAGSATSLPWDGLFTEQHQQQRKMSDSATARSTYAPLRYGNLVQPFAASTASPPHSASRAVVVTAQQAGGAAPADGATANATVSAAASAVASNGKPPAGRLSVSAAIRSARAGQQGERMHLYDGKPHVHVPTPQPEGGSVASQRPFLNPNYFNRTHVVSGDHGRARLGSGDDGESSPTSPLVGRPVVAKKGTLSEDDTYYEAPTPQRPLYTNLGVTLTDAAPATAGPTAAPPSTHAHAPYSTATATSHLFRDTAAVPTYGATGMTAAAATYAPAVRYANVGNPGLWNTYGCTGTVIGPASVAAARATADRERNAASVEEDAEAQQTSGGAGLRGQREGLGDEREGRHRGGKEKDDEGEVSSATSTTQSNSSGSLSQDMRDTGYLCLVMEYHPMGDLCHYVLRAKQQLGQQQQLAMRASLNHSAFDARAGAASSSTPTPSDHSSVVNAATAGAGGGAAYVSSPMANGHADPSSPTAALGASTASWIAAAAAATWRVRPAASASGPTLTGQSGGAVAEKEDPTSRNPLTEAQLLSIAYQLSSVLDHMHHQSPPIIHRDLKPENILIKGELTDYLEEVPAEEVRTGGFSAVASRHASKPASPLSPTTAGANAAAALHTPLTPVLGAHQAPPIRITRAVVPIVVTDFGLAMVQEQHGRSHHGRGGGTRPYIAPESWQGGTCTASDVWSLGCVLYALATGRLSARTVRLMSEEAKRDGFASRMLNDILQEKYSLAFASFVVSLLVVDPVKRPTAAQAARCFVVTPNDVRFDPSSPFFSNVLDL